jgi:alpha-beta hydrolase superfamily lysophospholipase
MPNAALLALEKQVLYHPRKYDPAVILKFAERGGKRIDYKTGQGAQSAWLIPAVKSEAAGKLWVICGGNGSLAMELEGLCRRLNFSSDSFLLVDYPGYGECKGEPSPAGIRENLKTAVPLVAKQLNIDPLQIPQRVCAFGHSLGCAAALLAVDEFKLRAAVLCAPFTSTMEMAHERFKVPLDFPFQHKFDNRTGMAVLSQNGGHAWILHGDADEVIPVTMSQTLAKEFAETVKLKVVPSGRHSDIFKLAAKEFLQAMTDARK